MMSCNWPTTCPSECYRCTILQFCKAEVLRHSEELHNWAAQSKYMEFNDPLWEVMEHHEAVNVLSLFVLQRIVRFVGLENENGLNLRALMNSIMTTISHIPWDFLHHFGPHSQKLVKIIQPSPMELL